MANNILFVFEGVKTEKLITDNLKKSFFDQENTIIQCAYGTTIYNLYKTISIDEDLDTFELLKNLPHNKQHLSGFKRNDFAEIYMFFDYDGHTTSASDEKLRRVLNFFNEETEFGKLFISYPMVEALKHCSELIDFKALKVEAKKKTNYKQLVNQACDISFINMPQYTLNIWAQLCELHLMKMNYLVTDEYSLPIEHSHQSTILENQLQKYIAVDSTVAVLSAFPIFIFDYFGFEYMSKFLFKNK
jgi:hypothetical protein